MERTCTQCGTSFHRYGAKAPEAKFCSVACKGIAQTRPKIACTICGKLWHPVKASSTKVCSVACDSERKRTSQLVPCGWCGTQFIAEQRRIKRYKSLFCCEEHRNLWLVKDKDAYTCKICGKEFLEYPSSKKFRNVTYCSRACQQVDFATSEHAIKMVAAAANMCPNRLEMFGYSLLDMLGATYQKQAPLAGKFCVDALFPDASLVVQFDGDYWHGHPVKFPAPDARQRQRIRLDKAQDAYLSVIGYRVLRLWESDIKRHPEASLARVAHALAVPSTHLVGRDVDHARHVNTSL